MALLLICGADGKKSKVEELTPSDFKSKVGLYFFFWAWMNCDDESRRKTCSMGGVMTEKRGKIL